VEPISPRGLSKGSEKLTKLRYLGLANSQL
jgi:hypothetical protein